MKNLLGNILLGLIAVTGIVFGFLSGFTFSSLQLETLKIVGIVCAVSVLYCFVVGEISRNNSQMDKLWSITPIIYAWIVVAMGQFNFRLVIMAILITIWGARLTTNFALKGAYTIRFWEGEEDYRWPILRAKPPFTNKFVWALFDLLFISFFQNVLVLGITFPMIAVMESPNTFMVMDLVAGLLTLGFIIYETIADIQQMKFQTTKHNMLKEGKKLEELPAPYNLGFNTLGLWNYSRHPNYLAEQAIWVCLYLFVIGAGVVEYGIFNWTIIPCMVLILLFIGSSVFGEFISSGKYPLYKDYQQKVFKYLPIRKYRK